MTLQNTPQPPPPIDPRIAQAMELHTAGAFDKAWDLYSALERENPKDADVVHLMGVLAGQVGNLLESVERIQRAIKINPKTPDFHKNLSITFRRLGDTSKAAASLINMGNALSDQNRLEEAVSAFAQAAEIDPTNEHAPNNQSVMLNRLGRYEEARDLLVKTLAPDPRMPEELAHWRGKKNKEGFLRQLPSVHLNLGNAYHGLGQLEESIASHRRGLELNPGLIEGHNDIAMALLLSGQYEEGWREFEWRWDDPKYARADFGRPRWNGESPSELGGPLFVLSEQGYGDAIMLCRYLKLLAAQGYEVMFETKPEMWTLFSEGLADENITLIPAATEARGYDHLDFVAYTGTFTMPRIFGTTTETVPADVPYLSVPQARVKRWAARLADPKGRKKVGIVWGGNPLHLRNFERSMPPDFLQPLLARKDVAFYSLQKGPAAQYKFPGSEIVVLDEALTDFAETAAAIQNLDLVIGVDTAVMHLTGALGVPAWPMLAHVPDWRWLMARDDSPWYPTARLFRQHSYGNWQSVVADVGAALDRLVGAG